jgi:hypothetical protein
MTLLIPPRSSAADWDVDVELQKELDAVSINSDVSSSSSSLAGIAIDLRGRSHLHEWER